MLFVHPPLAIAAYVLIFSFTSILILRKTTSNRTTNLIGLFAWVLTFLGLVSGMIWAQLAWGGYWLWDPKEVLTLALFLAVTGTMLANFEKHPTVTRWLSFGTCILVVLTGSSSFLVAGLHSFLG